MIYVIATITVKPEKEAALLDAARICVAATLKEEGCISYDLGASVTQPGTYIFAERWESREALAAHSQAEHFKVWRKAGADAILSRKVEILSGATVETL